MFGGHPSESGFNRDALRRMGVLDHHARGFRGADIAIGFVDYGFDAWHPAFQHAETGRSRFRAIRSQADGRTIEPHVHASARSARYDPHANYYGASGCADPTIGAHGTHMASIAAGSPCGRFVGAAPEASLFGAHLDLPDTAWKEIRSDGTPAWLDWDPVAEPVWRGWRSYADARPIADAIVQLYETASAARCDDGTPYRGVVLNLSVGTWAGPHNGLSRVCAAIDEVIARGEAGVGPPCAVVVGVGNAGLDRGHVCGRLAAGQSTDIDWLFDASATLPDKLEIWTARRPSDPAIECALHVGPADSSSEAVSFAIAPGPTTDVAISGRRCGVADYTPHASGNLDCIRIALSPRHFRDVVGGDRCGRIRWSMRLRAADHVVAPISFHAWRERNDAPNRSVLRDASPDRTLCDFACASKALVVGGVAFDGSEAAAFAHASRGPLPWGRTHQLASPPHVAASADRIWGARSLSRGFAPTSGTSAATALVSGAVALVFEQAVREGVRLQRDGLVRALTGWSRDDGAPTGRRQPALGFGCINLNQLREATI